MRSRKRSVVGPRYHEGGLRRIDGAARHLVHLVARDRSQQIGHPQIVVQSETKELGGLEERGDRRVGFEIPRQRANEVLLRLEQLLLGWAGAPAEELRRCP